MHVKKMSYIADSQKFRCDFSLKTPSRSVTFRNMIVLLFIMIAFVMNMVFLISECRARIWREARFWVALAVLVILTGTWILGQ